MSLLTLLADDLLAWLNQKPDGVARRVLLWLDPNAEFARLARQLEPALEQRGARLLRLAPEGGRAAKEERGQLAIKLELLRGDTAAERVPTVVCLPGYGPAALRPVEGGGLPALWALYEYRYTGTIWGRGSKWEPGQVGTPLRLHEWLRLHGLQLPEDRGRTTRELTDGGANSLLARYAEAKHDSEPASWPKPLRVDDVRQALAGDPRDRLRELLAAPTNAARSWDDPSLVLERIGGEYGLRTPEPLPMREDGVLDGEALADSFAVQLALTEAWDAFGRPDDFPYCERLPGSPERWARQVAFLREDVAGHTRLGPAFRERMRRLEPGYPLAQWAIGRLGAPVGLPLLARERWQQALAEFDAAASGGLSAAREWLRAQQAALAQSAGAETDGSDVQRGWRAIDTLGELVQAAAEATAAVGACRSAVELVARYTSEWWRVDAAHLGIRVACLNTPGLEQVRRIADLALFGYVATAGDAFSAAVHEAGGARSWPPTGLVPVERVRLSLWEKPTGGERRAVIVSDALRWDLAQRVQTQLTDASRTVTLEPVLSTLPSITPFGMSVLLPLDALPPDAARLTVDWKNKTIKDGASRVLSTRDGRKALLMAVLMAVLGAQSGAQSAHAAHAVVAFADMDALLAGAAITQADILVVFDNEIDQQGHSGGEQFPRLALDLAANVARAVERLHAAGIDEVHVVTDHGFLLLPPAEVDALGRPEVKLSQVERREPRWAAIRPDVPGGEVLRYRAPLDERQELGFPRGVRTLEAAQAYEHGGISLQECVLPHLVSRAATTALPLDVAVRAPRDQLTGGTVAVTLAPKGEMAGATLWAQPAPLTVRLWVEVADGPASGQRIAGPIEVEVRSDCAELRPALYLQEDLGFPLEPGQALRLRAVDKATGRELATIPLTLVVRWE